MSNSRFGQSSPSRDCKILGLLFIRFVVTILLQNGGFSEVMAFACIQSIEAAMIYYYYYPICVLSRNHGVFLYFSKL